MLTSSTLHGYFNPLVFWYQWEYLLTSKEFNLFFCRVSKIGNGYSNRIAIVFGNQFGSRWMIPQLDVFFKRGQQGPTKTCHVKIGCTLW